MTNPHLLKPISKRWNDPRFAGGKVYFAVFSPTGHRARRNFSRATDAQAYAEKLLTVCRRLYDESIVNTLAPAEEPAKS